MKAPFSKKAREIFKSPEALESINSAIREGKSLDNLKVKTLDGKEYKLRTSERYFAKSS